LNKEFRAKSKEPRQKQRTKNNDKKIFKFSNLKFQTLFLTELELYHPDPQPPNGALIQGFEIRNMKLF